MMRILESETSEEDLSKSAERHLEENPSEGFSMDRRKFLTAMGAVATAGCTGNNTEPETNQKDNTTETNTTNSTNTSSQQDQKDDFKTFNQIYMDSIAEDESAIGVLAPNWKERLEEQDYETFSHFLENLFVRVNGNINMASGTKLARNMKYALHNDLELSPDKVRVMERRGGGGGSYTSFLYKNQEGEWKKDVAIPLGNENGYLKVGKEEDMSNIEEELSLISNAGPNTSATAYHGLVEGNIKGTREDEEWLGDMELVDRCNDHIVVDEPYREATVGYTLPAAKFVSKAEHLQQNETFGEEMNIIEIATETWHNTDKPFIRMEMKDGEITAKPTEEHRYDAVSIYEK